MLTRREFVSVAAATMAVAGPGPGTREAVARQAVGLDHLLRFPSRGQLTLLHMTDCHAQLEPLYYREPSVNIGVSDMRGRPPHLTGADAIKAFGLTPGSPEAYALTAENFEALARTYGRVGGMDRLATLIRAIRDERGAERCLLLDGGDALQGSFTSLHTEGADMVRVLDALGVAATTGHWEFTFGAERLQQLYGNKHRRGVANAEFLAANVRDNEFEEPVFKGWQMFEKGGRYIAVIGQSYPYTGVAHPRWLVPKWWFGIREEALQRLVTHVRHSGADLVVLLSHNGFDVDRKLAGNVAGIDVILSGHTHDAIPTPERIGRTLVVASGSHGKFLSRLDIDLDQGGIRDWAYALIPVLADAIPPDAEMRDLIEQIRKPHAAFLATELARTEATLWRRGNFGGTLDDLVCEALLSERDAEIAMSPGFRWGGSLLAGQPITWEDIYNTTAITYPTAYRTEIRGAFLKAILEDVADNLFNPDPYYQQGGDMVRVGGLSFVIQPDAPVGQRISDLRLGRTDQPIETSKLYVVTGWGSLNEGTYGPPVWDVLADHLKARKIVHDIARRRVTLKRG
ncbi:MAG: thiosulfohydrolase SoxB [Hyphomicrobiaceae bacterium]